jgi:histidinol-phosphate aminotransferase
MNDRPRVVGPAELAAKVVRPEVHALSAYVVANAAGLIKLDAMENPYAPPAHVAARLAQALSDVAINRYPDGAAAATKAALSRALGLGAAETVLLGNGSDELIQIIASTLARPGAVMLAPEPTFVMYRFSALNAGMRFVAVPLLPDFTLDLPAMLAAIDRDRPALVFLSYPNNPTGNLFAVEHIEAVIRATPGLVVVDEAYNAFAGASFLPRIAEFPNLLVMRTLSKIGMAGIRLGYAVAAPAWIAEFNKLRPPYNVNALTQAAVVALLADTGWVDEQAHSICAERSRLETRLATLPGVSVYPTRANFVVARFPDGPAIFDGLKSRRVLVKNLDAWHPLLRQCLRITVGTPDENNILLSALNGLILPS